MEGFTSGDARAFIWRQIHIAQKASREHCMRNSIGTQHGPYRELTTHCLSIEVARSNNTQYPDFSLTRTLDIGNMI